MKKQFNIDKRIWAGMPVMIAYANLGKTKIRQPTMFVVKSFDDNYVTLSNVLPDTLGNHELSPDQDGEISKEPLTSTSDFTIPKKDFWKVCEPTIPPQQG